MSPSEPSSHRARKKSAGIALLVAAIVVGVVLWWFHFEPGRASVGAGVQGQTAHASFAGVFPSEEETPLANPLGIVAEGGRLFVAESDAGVIGVFDPEGARLGDIVLAPESGMPTAYPSVLAIADGRLAVVDNAGDRVIVVDALPADPAEVRLTLGAGENVPLRPTAVTYADGEYLVADAADGTIKAYDGSGGYLLTLRSDALSSLGSVGGLAVADDGLVVSGSNAGRVAVLDLETGKQKRTLGDSYKLPRALVELDGRRMAVVDTLSHAVYIVGADGSRLFSLDATSVPEGPLNSPRGAAWMQERSRLYVTDADLGRVLVYELHQ